MTQNESSKPGTPDYYWVYILHCDNDSYYTGYTVNLGRRYQDHVNGKAKYTRSFKPLVLAQAWKVHGDKATAMKIENFIKKLPREKKIELLTAPELLTPVFQAISVITLAERVELSKYPQD
jgi:putative endonuclease